MREQLRRVSKINLILFVIMAASVAVRVLAVLAMGNNVEILPGIFDQVSYHTLATRLLGGYGFTFASEWWPVTRAGQPTAHWSYLYTLYLTASYAIFGENPLIPRLVQAVLAGALMPWLLFRLARRVFDGQSLAQSATASGQAPRFARWGGFYQLLEDSTATIGLLAAAWVALYGYLVYYAAALMTETFYILAILWTLDCCLRIYAQAQRGESIPAVRWLELGLAIGVTVLLRQVFLPFVPFIFIWLVWVFYRQAPCQAGVRPGQSALHAFSRTMIGGLLAVVVLAAMIAPFTILNYRQFGRFVLLNTNAGYAYFWANHPIYGMHYSPLLSEEMGTYSGLIPAELKGLDEAALEQALLRLGLGFVVADPGRYILLSLSRIPAYFTFWPTRGSSLLSNLNRLASFTLALPFMLAGLFLWVKDVRKRITELEPGALLLLFVLIYTAVHLLSWASIRYRLPVDAVLLVFAARALYALTVRVAYKN